MWYLKFDTILCVFLWDWYCKADALLLEPHLQSIFSLVIVEMGSCKIFAHVGLKPQFSQTQPSMSLWLQVWATWSPVPIWFFLHMCTASDKLWFVESISNSLCFFYYLEYFNVLLTLYRIMTLGRRPCLPPTEITILSWKLTRSSVRLQEAIASLLVFTYCGWLSFFQSYSWFFFCLFVFRKMVYHPTYFVVLGWVALNPLLLYTIMCWLFYRLKYLLSLLLSVIFSWQIWKLEIWFAFISLWGLQN
jgi:hypothetical protein